VSEIGGDHHCYLCSSQTWDLSLYRCKAQHEKMLEKLFCANISVCKQVFALMQKQSKPAGQA
jgi:hypothetical protein